MGLLGIAQLDAEAPVVRVHPAHIGKDADEAGELHRGRLGQRLGRDEPRALKLGGELEQVVQAPVEARGRRAAQLGAGLRAAAGRPRPGTCRRASRRPRRRSRRAPRSPCSSRSAAAPAGRSASRRRTAGPRHARAGAAPSSRAAPPAGRGRGSPPRPQRAPPAPSPAWSPRPSGRRARGAREPRFPRRRGGRRPPPSARATPRPVAGRPRRAILVRWRGGSFRPTPRTSPPSGTRGRSG